MPKVYQCQYPGCKEQLPYIGGRPPKWCTKHATNPSQARGRKNSPDIIEMAVHGADKRSKTFKRVEAQTAALSQGWQALNRLKMAVGLGMADGDYREAAALAGILGPGNRPLSDGELKKLAEEARAPSLSGLREASIAATGELFRRILALNAVGLLAQIGEMTPTQRVFVGKLCLLMVEEMGGEAMTWPVVNVDLGGPDKG